MTIKFIPVDFDKKLLSTIQSIIQKNFGEIGDFVVENDEVAFSVYRDYFENAPEIIVDNGIKLSLIEKSDEYFMLGYKITL